MRKKVFSVVILSLVLVHLAGFYIYFVARLGEIRLDMRMRLADLPADQLQLVSIPTEKFQAKWLEELEMEWQGHMYDIARVQPMGDEMIVYCLRDKDEDDLLSFINALVDMTRQDTRPVPTQVVQFFSLKYVPSLPLTFAVASDKAGNSLAYSSIFPASRSVVPSTPPPRA